MAVKINQLEKAENNEISDPLMIVGKNSTGQSYQAGVDYVKSMLGIGGNVEGVEISGVLTVNGSIPNWMIQDISQILVLFVDATAVLTGQSLDTPLEIIDISNVSETGVFKTTEAEKNKTYLVIPILLADIPLPAKGQKVSYYYLNNSLTKTNLYNNNGNTLTGIPIDANGTPVNNATIIIDFADISFLFDVALKTDYPNLNNLYAVAVGHDNKILAIESLVNSYTPLTYTLKADKLDDDNIGVYVSEYSNEVPQIGDTFIQSTFEEPYILSPKTGYLRVKFFENKYTGDVYKPAVSPLPFTLLSG